MSDKNIYQRINNVMKAVKYVQKDSQISGGGQNYKAVTHDQLVSVARQAMVDNGIMIYPNQISGEFLVMRDMNVQPNPIKMGLYTGTYEVNFVNIDDGADKVKVTVQAHANDNGDKAPGKSLTYAVKSAVLKVLFLETGENDESRAPEPISYTDQQKAQFDEILEAGHALNFVCFNQTVGPDIMMALNGSFEKGKISSGKQKCKDLEREGWAQLKEYARQISEYISNEDPAVAELVDELNDTEKRLVAGLLSQTEIQYLRSIK